MRHTNTIIGISALALGLTLATGTLAGNSQQVPMAEFQARGCQTCQTDPAVRAGLRHIAAPQHLHGAHPVAAPAIAPGRVPAPTPVHAPLTLPGKP